MAMNLRLPICPKCNDTKYVARLTTVKTCVGAPEHVCTKCEICWGAHTSRGRMVGTIEEYKEYIYENNLNGK